MASHDQSFGPQVSKILDTLFKTAADNFGDVLRDIAKPITPFSVFPAVEITISSKTFSEQDFVTAIIKATKKDVPILFAQLPHHIKSLRQLENTCEGLWKLTEKDGKERMQLWSVKEKEGGKYQLTRGEIYKEDKNLKSFPKSEKSTAIEIHTHPKGPIGLPIEALRFSKEDLFVQLRSPGEVVAIIVSHEYRMMALKTAETFGITSKMSRKELIEKLESFESREMISGELTISPQGLRAACKFFGMGLYVSDPTRDNAFVRIKEP